MQLRFILPPPVFLISEESGALERRTIHCRRRAWDVKVSFEGGEVQEWDNEGRKHYYRILDGLSVWMGADSISSLNEDQLFDTHVDTGEWIYRIVRNFGVVPGLTETLPRRRVSKLERGLQRRSWKVEQSADGGQWNKVAEPSSYSALAAMILYGDSESIFSPTKTAELKAERLDGIAEALEDGQAAPPELEFLTNVIGYLRAENYRLAVLDAVICLEVVLTDFVTQYMTAYHDVTREELRAFLSPDFTLNTKLAGMLYLTLTRAELSQVDVKSVRRVVGWRNKVVHVLGRLPDGLRPQDVDSSIAAVLLLTNLLAVKRDNLRAHKELTEISRRLADKLDIGPPRIDLAPGHQVLVSVRSYPIAQLNMERMREISTQADALLGKRDARFDSLRHLRIVFQDFLGKEVGIYEGGEIRAPAGETSRDA